MINDVLTNLVFPLIAMVAGGVFLAWYKNETKRNETIGKIKVKFIKLLPFLPSLIYMAYLFIIKDKVDKLFLFTILMQCFTLIYFLIDRIRFDLKVMSNLVSKHNEVIMMMTKVEILKKELDEKERMNEKLKL